jgi:hypothetical protein
MIPKKNLKHRTVKFNFNKRKEIKEFETFEAKIVHSLFFK